MAILIDENRFLKGAAKTIRHSISPSLSKSSMAEHNAQSLEGLFEYIHCLNSNKTLVPDSDRCWTMAQKVRSTTWASLEKSDLTNLMQWLHEDSQMYRNIWENYQNQLKPNGSEENLSFRVPSSSDLTEVAQKWMGISDVSAELIGQVTGGFSKQTVLFNLHLNNGEIQKLVMRRDLPFAKSRSSVTMEFPVIKALYELGIPVPEPLYLGDDPSILETPFLISRRVEGRTLGNALGLQQSIDFNPYTVFGNLLAGLHKVDVDALNIPGLSDSKFNLESQIERIKEWEALYRSNIDIPSAALEIGLAWLQENAHLPLDSRVLVHGDIGYHNILFDGSDLTALLDWELVRVGSTAEDLAYISLVIDDEEELLRAYTAAGGTRPSQGAMLYCQIFSAIRNSILGVVGMNQFNQGAHQEISLLPIILETYTSYMGYLERKLSEGISHYGFKWNK